MNPFNREKDMLLIELVKKYPVLYDPAHENFRNCIIKHNVWTRISASVQVPDLKKRWKHFRDHFQKKLRAENAGLRSLHSWEYQNHLSFLAKFSNQRESTKAGALTDEENEEDNTPQGALTGHEVLEIHRRNEEAKQNAIARKRKKFDTLAATLESRLADKFRLETSSSEKSPTHKYFESMADIVAKFPPHLVAEARLKVCQAVNEIELKHQTEQSLKVKAERP